MNNFDTMIRGEKCKILNFYVIYIVLFSSSKRGRSLGNLLVCFDDNNHITMLLTFFSKLYTSPYVTDSTLDMKSQQRQSNSSQIANITIIQLQRSDVRLTKPI